MMRTHRGLLPWRAAAASEADFEALYRAELPRVFNFFLYRTGDERLAEDLTADTFEKAWRQRQRYRSDLAAFSTWLFTIARRVAIDHYRKQRATVRLDGPEAAQATSPDDSPEAHALAQADLARLGALLSRLADRERELVALKYGAGLTNRAIAALSGLSESNVGVILHRALRALRTMWENEP